MFATGGRNVFARRAGDVKFSAVAFGEAPPQVKTVQISKVNLHIRLQQAGNEEKLHLYSDVVSITMAFSKRFKQCVEFLDPRTARGRHFRSFVPCIICVK